MFFSRKGDKLAQTAAQSLADYYALSTEQTQPWCEVDNGCLSVTLPFCALTQHAVIRETVTQALSQAGFPLVELAISQQVRGAETAIAPVTNIRNVVAVASGKGGVGKSTTSLNLAFALMQEGARVGILDADIYGPSVPIMLGNPQDHPVSGDNKHMQPLKAWGMVANSIGYLVPAEDAAVWRGPMASRALKQLLDETLWPVLDYLIVDMPPGTGDIQLTMAQQVPLSAAVIVTTPQDLAVADAQKGISMFNKVNVPVAGLIENMSYYQCSSCGHTDYLFAQDGGKALAERYNLPLLGALPLDVSIREQADLGKPLVADKPDSELAGTYREAARALSMQMALTLPSRSSESYIRGETIGLTKL
ncbi:iron-sulfur cluster carrier protein ApbC [Alteromonas sp. RKMC-009]|uniref:iron-sulfur cluster carrier protein ApbC n=1 Tax=Alteromonas sp. RKMC-009 TaxID=2267264 RepID=UPI000E67D650|nr:iron-sulfur cluster carrier protein ApbC [Alteromonas sp. RKMC-009]AYA64931.1 iron-sulfur cluster carrier protein ApbC [Alteromonas sp. RKMC-009]